ncbi:MAG: DUF11 domain-containing protein [Gemmatimonadota bacterium]|nr:MAG: DUF11 domain-containing protein [Gemmatimonadota bacterium]
MTTSVGEQADLEVTKTGPANELANDTVTYVITTTNNGPSTATNVTVTDTLPSGVTFLAATNGGVYTEPDSVVTWTIASLANGASQVDTVKVLAPATGTLDNVAAAASDTGDPDATNDTSSVMTAVTEQADLEVAKTGPATALVGDTITYVITTANNGPSDAQGVVVSDQLPAGVTFVSTTRGASESGGVVTWPVIASLASGASVIDTVKIVAAAPGSLLDIASATAATADPDGSNNDGSAPAARVTTTVGEQADIEVAKTGPSSASPGDTITYVITVTNIGPSAAIDVVLTDPLPAGVTYVSSSRGATESGNVVTWPAHATLAVDESFVDTLVVLAPSTSPVENVASTAASTVDPNTDNNTGRHTTTILQPNLALTKESVRDFEVGEPGSYILTVTNEGPISTIGPITLADTLPAGLTYNSHAGDGWSCTVAADIVTCTYPAALAPGASTTLTLTVDVGGAAVPGVTNRAVVSTEGDSDGDDDTSSTTTTVSSAAQLFLDKTVSRDDVAIGDFVDYTVRVQNIDNDPATDVEVQDDLPAGFTYEAGRARVDGVPIADPAGSPGPHLVFIIGVIQAGETVALTYRVEVGAGAHTGDGVNSAVAWSPALAAFSNEGKAKVMLRDDVFGDEGTIAGKIFVQYADEVGGVGVPGVRFYLEDGTSAVTDSEGKYHFAGISPRLHVVRVDETTLPAGAELMILSNRHALDPRSLFVDLKKGELHRADFAIAATPEVLQAVGARQQQSDLNAAIVEGAAIASEQDVGEPDFARRTEEWTFYPILPDSTLNEITSNLPVLRPRDPDGIDPLSEGALRIWVPETTMPADGLTPVPVRVRLEPGGRDQVPTRTTITLETSLGRWDVVDENPRLPGVQVTLERGNGEFMLVAPPQPDTGLVRVTAGSYSDRAQLAFAPARRGLFFAGVIDARVELRSLAMSELGVATRRDRFEDELTELAVDSDDGKFRAETRAGLFLKGEVLRDYLVTVHFDSEADGRSRLFRDIRPDELYPIYGDASIQGFDAQSTRRFYARVDRERSSLLYGDFVTPPATGERQLGAYYRSLTGLLGHFEKDGFTVDAFASRGDDRQVIDEIPGQGISGPYQLSRSDGLINSERVEIITRDRNQPAVILRAEPQARFADYTLEPLSGRLVFRKPIPSLDSNLNPLSIRVTYEVEQGDEQFWVYGAGAQGRATDRVELGGSLVRDDNPAGTQEVYSANATFKLRDDLFLVGEYAWSDSANTSDGDGVRLELRHVAQRLQARAFLLDTDTSFANRSSALGRGRREFGLRADGLFGENTRLFGEFIRTEDLFTDGTRWGLQAAATRRVSDGLDLELGYRHSEESAAPASGTTAGATPYTTNTLRARMTGRLLSQERVSLFGEWEQDLSRFDRHRGTLGGDYRFSERGRLYAQHELISSLAGPYALNSTQTQNNTVIGLETDYLKNTQVFSEYRLRDAFNGRESHAAIGLRNRWPIKPGLRLDTSLERVAPLAGSGANALAITGALEYTAHPDIKGTARLEYRTTGLGDQWFGSLGYAHKVDEEVVLLVRSALSWMLDTRLYERTQLGLAFRQDEVNRWNALLRYEHKYDRDESVPDLERTRQAHILSAHANYRVTLPFVLSSQLAGKWVSDASQGLESSTNAYLLGLRGLASISPRFDAVVNMRGLASGDFDSKQFGFGAELGYILMRNLRVAAGYNVFGFRDQDLAGANYTDHGFYLQVGYKFDEYTFGKKTSRDTDRDGVIDELDLCQNTPPGDEVDTRGCTLPKDRDGDGVLDQFDACPGTPLGEQVDASGCPLPKDADGDGVIDSLDRCPGTPLGEPVDASGCPLPRDGDGDGVLDSGDDCPDTPAGEEVNERGCPILFVAGATTLTLEGVNFEFDRSDLTPESLPILDRVAELLLANPAVRVEVAGHTDIRGSHAYNMWLSMARANSVRDYLIGRGVAAERMEASGYGPDEPIDTNDTAWGRANNRRVELRRIE